MASDRLRGLLHAAQELFPGATIEVGRSATAKADVRQFGVLPRRHGPRLAVPADLPRAARATALHRSSSDGWARLAARTAFAFVLGSPLRNLVMRDALVVSEAGDTIEEYLASALGMRVRVAISIGAPRANRKPVLDVYCEDGHRLGFAKIGTTPLTSRLVRHEVDTLVRLEGRLTELDIPTVLHAGQWHGHEVLVVSALPGRRSRHSLPVAAIRELAVVTGRNEQLVDGSPWLAALRERALRLGSGRGDRLAALVQAYEERHGPCELSFGAWHGDWGRWNMTWCGDRPQVWDWERFATDVPLGLDVVHFTAHRAIARAPHRHTHQLLRTAVPSALEQLGLEPTTAAAVVDAYLLEAGARFVTDASREHDAVTRLADRYLGAAEARLGTHQPDRTRARR